jgi:uncharacterized DUF497 family protein
VKSFAWDEDKNQLLKAERDISFEEVISAIATGAVLDIIESPNQEKHPGQRMFVVQMRAYAWLVPFAENDVVIFLKTIIPSRKATKRYLGGKDDEGELGSGGD